MRDLEPNQPERNARPVSFYQIKGIPNLAVPCYRAEIDAWEKTYTALDALKNNVKISAHKPEEHEGSYMPAVATADHHPGFVLTDLPGE